MYSVNGMDVEGPTFSLDNRLTDGGKVISLTRRPNGVAILKFYGIITMQYKEAGWAPELVWMWC
jgi:hypothetical protein